MGYSTAMYAVDIDQIRKTVGSKDAALIRKLKSQVDDESDDGEISMAQAVEELLNGTFTDPASAHQYGYALEQLCALLGTWLDSDLVGDVQDVSLETPLEDQRPPIALPEIDDFPFISSLSKEPLHVEVARLESMDLSFPDDEDIEESRRELLECLKQAAAKGHGVVTFYY